MISIGNDIVSLKAIDKNRTKEKRFYSKILSDSELKFYHQKLSEKISFENFVWLLWSVKESTYKFFKRKHHELVFNPRKIIIQGIKFSDYNTFCTTTIYFENNFFYARSIVKDEFIHTVVNDENNFEKIYCGIKSIDDCSNENQSKEVRSFLLNELKTFYPLNTLKIDKHPSGYPFLLKDEKETSIPISISHHKNFIAYSFALQ